MRPQPVPDSPLDSSTGRLRFGVFDGEFPRMNLDQAWIQWRGLKIPPPLTRLRLKQWQHFALVMPQLYVGLAVVDAGLMRTSWCHVVDRRTGAGFEHRRMGARLGLGVARELWEGVTWVREKGYLVELHNHLRRGEHRLKLKIEAREGMPSVEASLRCTYGPPGQVIQPLVVLLEVGPNRGMYSHKAPLLLEGTVRVGDGRVEARLEECFAVLDVHKAHYPRHTWWRWATFAWRDPAGRSVGLNLTRNVCGEDDELNENAVWLCGRLHHLATADFELDPQQVLQPWRLSTRDGAVDLRFTPLGERSENLRRPLVRSVFHQLHGTFEGRLTVEGETVLVRDAFGLCEDHDSLW